MNQCARAHSVPFFLTLLWGLTFPLIKEAVNVIPPSLFIILRLAVASLILLPFILAYRKKTSFTTIKWTVVLGFFQSATYYIFQSIGLETVSSANSAFLTAFSVVVVPFLELVFLRKKLQWFDFAAALLCLVGIFIPIDADIFTLISGDFWTLACALSYGCYIMALQAFSKKLKLEDTTLALSYQLAFLLFLPLLTSPYENMGAIFSWSVVIPVLFYSIFATCLVFYLQLRYQRYVSMRKAVLIYAFEPIFSRIFAYLLNREKIYLNNIRGLLILITFLLPELASFKKPQPVTIDN